MKKMYEKPYIAVESFQLDAAIAQGCSQEFIGKVNSDENSCGYGSGASEEKTFMFFNWQNCAVDVTYADGNDAVCYHGPTSTSGLYFFRS